MKKNLSGFDFQPLLKGRLVRLRPLVEQDCEPLYRASSDPLIWEQLPRSEREKRDVFQKFFDESLSLKTTLVITELKGNEIIGSSRYARFDSQKREIEIGWTFLSRRYWGKGHNAEVKKLMMDHAFKFVDSIFFVAATTNYRSRKAIEKLGAEFERELDWPPGAEVQDKSVMYRVRKGSEPKMKTFDRVRSPT